MPRIPDPKASELVPVQVRISHKKENFWFEGRSVGSGIKFRPTDCRPKSGLPIVFVNKILLELSFVYIYGCFHAIIAKGRELQQRPYTVCRT